MTNLSSNEVNLLRQNARSMVRELGLLNDAYFAIGVTLAERHLLLELTSCASPTMGEIAERLLLDKSTASRLIARAVKKGYVQCIEDEKDKRKRYLHLTELGMQTINAFEPIAFNQTKEALLCLSKEEIELTHKGVALYAKGLKSSRLKSKNTPSLETHSKNPEKANPETLTETIPELYKQLALLGFILKPFNHEDENALHEIFKEVVDNGTQFPYESNTNEEFHLQFFGKDSQVFVCHHISTKEVVGGFFIKPNYSGRSSHIANAAYMIKSQYRCKGIGSLLIKASLAIAKNLGFCAMQYNMVLSQNTQAIKLYQKLGFKIIGIIPNGVRNRDRSYQDGYVIHRELPMQT